MTDPSFLRSSRLLVVIALVVGLASGVGIALLLSGGEDPGPVPVAVDGTTRDGDPEALAELPSLGDPTDPSAATDAEAALQGFLVAEATGDWMTSYGFLASSALTAYPSEALWVNAHADFPQVTGYRVDAVEPVDDGQVRITTLTGFEPTVDPVLGLVPARGRSTWTVVAEGGLWRVEATTTENRPLYPGADGAPEAARAWVDGRVACEDTASLEADLVGSPTLADQLCTDDQAGTVELGEVRSLSDGDGATGLLAEFGPEVFAWARVVPVQAATPLQVVLGPVGEVWQVVGVLPRL